MLPRFLQPVLIAALALTTVATAQQANVTHAKPNYGKLPLVFEANQGQTDPSVKFLTRGEGYTAFLTSSGLTLSLRSPEAATADHASASAANRTLQLNFLGTRKNSSVSGEEKQSGRVNYFLGSNPALWHTNVPTYGEVRYNGIYRGIDLLYHGTDRQLEYDLEVRPGADPRAIKFEVQGADQIKLDVRGNLLLKIDSGELRLQCPVVYQ